MERQILVFAKTPALGRVKTRLQAGVCASDALELHRAFVQDTLDLALAARPDRLRIDFSEEAALELLPEAQIEVGRQVGDSLGERLAHAVREIFAQKSGALLILGTDSPDLPQARLHAAFEALSSADVVLCPAADGGYVLIGLAGPYTKLFERIDWSTSLVAEQTRQRAREEKLRMMELEPWFDVDQVEDLLRLGREIEFRQMHGLDFPRRTAKLLERLSSVVGSR